MELSEAWRRFDAIVDAPEDAGIDLARAALLIAAAEYPDLSIERELQHLDAIAAGVAHRLDDDSPLFQVNTLSEYLFDDLKFAGNHTNYYDPRNSFLNEVLETKVGIPITLSVIYMEVGRRLGLALVGIGFPGHFLVRYSGPDGERILDPFLGGANLSEAQLAAKLRNMYGENNPLAVQVSKLLTPATKKEILTRMLGNLKGVYLNKGDFERALSVIDRMVLIRPDAAAEFRDRGAVQQRLGRMQGAVRDFKKYLELAPDAPDADRIRTLIQRSVAQLN